MQETSETWVQSPGGEGKRSRSLRKTDQWGYAEGEGRAIQENQVLMGGRSDPLHQIQSSSTLGSGRSPGEEIGYPLQYSWA